MIFGFTPYDGLSTGVIATLLGVNFFGYTLRGAFGFGAGLPIILLMSFLIPPHEAIVLHSTATLVSQFQLLPQGIRDGDWKISKSLILGFFVSTILGVWIFSSLQENHLKITMGALLLIVIVGDMTNLLDRVTARIDLRRPIVPFSFASIAGIIGTIAGGGTGYFLSVYLKWATENPKSFRGTSLLMAVFYASWRFILLLVAGWISWQLLLNAICLIPVIVLGGISGRLVSERMSTPAFYRAVQIMLIFAAVILVVKGLGLIPKS
jgi:uncharacterized membrane protein YfcA